jgi:D-alanyl-D-alanine carboxypeptidase
METQSMSSPDGVRQMSFGVNRTKHQTVDENGAIVFGPIDYAMGAHFLLALCGPDTATAKAAAATPFVPVPVDRLSVKR